MESGGGGKVEVDVRGGRPMPLAVRLMFVAEASTRE